MNYKRIMISDKIKVSKKLLILILLSLIVNISYADTISTNYEGLSYTINTDTNEATCAGLASGTQASGDLVIPDYIEYEENQYPVTEVRSRAFFNKKDFTGSLTIGNSVITIGEYAFSNCSGFTGSLTIGNSVTTIGNNAFEFCGGFIELVTLGSSVTTIGEQAFVYCTRFTGSLRIPDSVIVIGESAFYGCLAFDGSLTIGNSVTTIGPSAFSGCSGLTGSLTIPNFVTTIGGGAFSGCSGFTGSLTIPNSVTEIGNNAFKDCSGLYGTLSIGDSVTTIGSSAFSNTNFTEIISYNQNPPSIASSTFDNSTLTMPLYVPMESIDLYRNTYPWFSFTNIYAIGEGLYQPEDGTDFEFEGIWYTIISVAEKTVKTRDNGYEYGHQNLTGSLIIPSTVNYLGDTYTVVEIGENSFNLCQGLTGELVLPETLITIGENAFGGCSGFSGSLTIPDSVTEIGSWAFYGCSGFTGSLTIPDSVTTIHKHAFWKCSGFTGSLTIPNSVTTIHEGAFLGCSGFTGSLTIPNSVTTIPENAFGGCSGFTGSLTIPDSVTEIGSWAFYECSGFTGSLTIPDSVITIGDFAFNSCDGFTGSLTIGNSVMEIGPTAFGGCSGFSESLTIGNSVMKIGSSAFGGCSGFSGSLTIPDSVTEIGIWAFYGCSGFTGTLTLGKSLSSIGFYCFNGTNFDKVESYNTMPPLCEEEIFSTYPNELYVPGSSIPLYKEANVWKNFFSINPLPDTEPGPKPEDGTDFEVDSILYTIISVDEKTVKTRDNGYQYGHQNLTGPLVIPSTVQYYGDNYTVVEIGDYSFYKCTNLKGALELPETLISIGEHAFDECYELTGSLIIPDSVTEIGKYSFSGCSGFKGSLTIGNSVTNVGDWAFNECQGFNGDLVIPNSVKRIGDSAFRRCTGFQGTLTIGNSVTEIAHDGFIECSGFTGDLIIPDSVITIGQGAFHNCKNFNGSLIIGNSVTNIGPLVFNYSGFNNLTLGNSVSSIGFNSFGEIKLQEIISLNPTPPNIQSNTFDQNTYENADLFTPTESVQLYKNATGWKNFRYVYGTVEEPEDGLDFEVDGIIYTIISVEEKTVKTRDNGYEYGHQNLTGSLIIPSTVKYYGENYTVVEIGENSFYSCEGLTGELILPETLKVIGNQAFYGCQGIIGALIIPDKVTYLGSGSFFACSGLSGSLTIGNSVNIIGDGAFSECYGFTGSLTIPDSVTSIQDSAFSGCNGFTGSLTIPNSVTTIGSSAFSGCSGFTGSLTIPDSVEIISPYAFWGCSGFTGSLTIGNSVVTIGDSAFDGCSGFTGSLTIPDSVEIISPYAFFTCRGFNGTLTIGNGVTTIGRDAFNDCHGFMGSLILGNSIVTIDQSAFSECPQFTGPLNLPETLVEIGFRAFNNCSNLTGELVIPNSVRSIDYQAFKNCYGLNEKLIIGESVTEMEWGVFEGIDLKEILSLNPTPPSLELNIFDNDIFQKAVLYVPTESVNAYKNAEVWKNFRYVYEIGAEPADGMDFEDQGILYTIISVEEKTVRTRINGYQYGHKNLTGSLVIPSTVQYYGENYTVIEIGEKSFYECKGLTGELVLPEALITIGEYAFGSCSGFTGSLTIGNSVEEIGEGAFWGCNHFTGSLTIPNSVITIGHEAFYHCSGFIGSLIIGNSVTTISSFAFRECFGFTGSLNIPNSVIEIGDGAFRECTGFSGSLTIPNSVIKIGPTAFYNCTGLNESLTIGNSVTTIGDESFYNCNGFTGSLTIPDSVTEIGYNAFYNCSGFTGSLTIPNSVTEIDYAAFNNCYGFNGSLTIGNSVTTIGAYVFNECSGFTGTLSLGESVSLIGSECFNGTNFEKVDSYNITPPQCDEEIFSTYPNELFVPGSSIPLYKEANVWRYFFNIKPLPGSEVEAEEVILNVEALTMTIGQTTQLTATILPENAIDQTVTWSSDNEEVVTVSQDGTVTAVYVGTANIIATCGNVSTTCRVTVNPIVATGVSLNMEAMTLAISQTNQLIATVYPENATDRTVYWESDNESVATVGNDGMVTAVSVGTATITVTCGNVSATCSVRVNPIVATGVSLNMDAMTLTIGQTNQLTATVYPENTTNPTVTWTSDNEKVATVSTDGVVTAISVGTASITATIGTESASCRVTVNPIVATGVTLNIEAMTLVLGESSRLTATITPENTTDRTLIWSSDNEEVATVDSEGMVTSHAQGLAVITATCGNVSASCRVTVRPVLASEVTLNRGNLSLSVGESSRLTATVYPENTTDPKITWTSNNTAVATVGPNGTVTAVSVGTATITATCGDVYAICEVNVTWPQPVGISLSPLNMVLREGETGSFKVTFSPANAQSALTWFSEDTSIASVNDFGEVTALRPGMTIIGVMSQNEVVGMATIRVTDDSVVSISITPDNITLDMGQAVELAAQLYPVNAASKITWVSKDPTVATVNDYGVVTAVGKGATFIYATAENGVSGIAVVTVVNSKEASSVTIEPGSIEMIVGHEEQFEAVVTPSTFDSTISWLSSDPAVAEVNQDGLVSAISPGVAVIYALSSNGMTGMATVKVYTNDVSSITIDPDILTLDLQEMGQLRATIEPAVAESPLVWSSNDEEVATIDEYGMVTAESAGVAVITATADNGVVGMAIVRVIDPNAGDNPDSAYGDNGAYVSALRIREGDQLGLFAERPIGYENNDWSYDWYLGNQFKAEGKSVMVPAGEASGWKGTDMNISAETYEVDITNRAGNQIILDLPTVSVYSRPLTPDELIKKGDGATCSFVAMSSLSDTQLSNLGYSFVFGYNDEAGVSHVISTGKLRYCHTSKQIYDNQNYRFWVYTSWTFPDGATITSGLRYLDGSVDERFNKSDYNFSKSGKVAFVEGETRTDIYTLDGIPMGSDLSKLAPGIYVIWQRTGDQVITQKVIKR